LLGPKAKLAQYPIAPIIERKENVMDVPIKPAPPEMKMFMVQPPRLAVTVDQPRASLTRQKSILLGATLVECVAD